MATYRHKTTGAYGITEAQIKAENPNVSYPVKFRSPDHDLVFPVPKPTVTNLQRAIEGPPELTAIGIYQQTWEIVDKFQDYTDPEGVLHTKEDQEAAFLTKELQETKDTKKAQLSALYSTYLYVDTSAIFPSGPADIQFRDDTDRMNLANVVQAAQALIIAGTPSETLVYRTQDNVNQEVTASQMVMIGMAVMTEKQLLLDVFWGHKDNIEAIIPSKPVNQTSLLEAIDIVNNYDINAGWEA